MKNFKRVKNQMKTVFFSPMLYRIRRKSPKGSKAILIIGDSRSGTSWLGDLVSKSTRGRILFEPTNLNYENLGFEQLPDPLCFSIDKRNEKFDNLMGKILSGQTPLNYFVDRGNRAASFQCTVIKDLRLGWAIPYLRNYFKNIPTIFIIRHPLGTIRSQFKAMPYVDIQASRQYYLKLCENEILRKEIFDKYGKIFSNEEDDVLNYKMFLWCCYHRFFWDYFIKDQQIFLCPYESLLQAPLKTLGLVQKFLTDKGFQTYPVSIQEISTPSRTTRKEEMSNLADGDKKWQAFFNSAQQEHLLSFLKYFSLDFLYTNDGAPSAEMMRYALKA